MMGCNIHGFIEVLSWPNSERTPWQAVHEIPYTRNYVFYAVLAGVRNYCGVVPISEPKGMPKDPSMMSRVEAEEDGPDGHTHSWLKYRELKEYDWLQTVEDFMIIDKVHVFFKALMGEMRFLSGEYGEEGVRMVFWFDN